MDVHPDLLLVPGDPSTARAKRGKRENSVVRLA